MSFTCPDCLGTSVNPHDEIHSYCGRCHSFKPFNMALTVFQSRLAKAIHGNFPATAALKATIAFQAETKTAWQNVMLECLALFHATRLSKEQWAALDQVCGLAAGKARGHRHP